MNSLKETLSETEKSKLLQEFEAVKGIHKNFMNSFEIITPRISAEMVAKNEITSIGNEAIRHTWIQIPKTQLFFDQMITNYEREMGDNLYLKKELFHCCFYCCTRLINHGFKRSDKWVVTGFLSVDNELMIPFCWMHPYLRGHGIFRRFLTEYSQNFGPLMFEAPVSQRLQKIIGAVSEEIYKSPEMLKKYIVRLRAWLSLRYSKNTINLDDEAIQYAICALNLNQCLNAKMDRASELKMIIAFIHLQKYCNGDVSKVQELFPDIDITAAERGVFMETVMKQMIKIRTLGGNADRMVMTPETQKQPSHNTPPSSLSS